MLRKFIYLFTIALIFFLPVFTHAQNSSTPNDVYEKMKITSVTPQPSESTPDTNALTPVQQITAQVTSGPDSGQTVTFNNDYIQLSIGDSFYARKTTNPDSTVSWSLTNPYRLNVLLVLLAIFIILIFLFGGAPGIRGLASLAGGIVLIFYLFLPGLYAGYSPVILSLGIAAAIIIVGSYITHGFNRTTSSAVIGMILTVLITGALAYVSVHTAHLTGYESEEATYVTTATNGGIDMVGLLFGGIMIGLLGVLYDISIGQAVAVEELLSISNATDDESQKYVRTKALRIGREHIGALVNTLAIAYVGVYWTHFIRH